MLCHWALFSSLQNCNGICVLYAHITYEYTLSLISPNYVSERGFKRSACLCICLCGDIYVFNTFLWFCLMVLEIRWSLTKIYQKAEGSRGIFHKVFKDIPLRKMWIYYVYFKKWPIISQIPLPIFTQ